MKKLRVSIKAIAVIAMLILCLPCLTVMAKEVKPSGTNATVTFNLHVSSNTFSKQDAGTYFEAGETVTVKGYYSPSTATIKYGFVAPDGKFYSIQAENGILDYTFTTGKRGTYYFTVVNNSTVPVSVSGYINY